MPRQALRAVAHTLPVPEERPLRIAVVADTHSRPHPRSHELIRADAAKRAKGCGAAMIVCGHSHVPFMGRDRDLLVFNPGSIGPRRFTLPITFGVIEAIVGDPLAARRVVALLMVGTVATTWMKRFDLERSLLWILGAGMIFTPTLHPWYVLWMLPMAVLRGSRPWLLLSGLAFTGYFGLGSYQDTGEWAQPLLARAVLWLPFFVLLVYDAWSDRRARAGEPAA